MSIIYLISSGITILLYYLLLSDMCNISMGLIPKYRIGNLILASILVCTLWFVLLFIV